jgi:hypothetical protein
LRAPTIFESFSFSIIFIPFHSRAERMNKARFGYLF